MLVTIYNLYITEQRGHGKIHDIHSNPCPLYCIESLASLQHSAVLALLDTPKPDAKTETGFRNKNLNIRFPGKLHSLLVITHAEVTTKNGLKYQREISMFVHTYEQFHFGKFDSSSVIV
jgi:hypothetical protein